MRAATAVRLELDGGMQATRYHGVELRRHPLIGQNVFCESLPNPSHALRCRDRQHDGNGLEQSTRPAPITRTQCNDERNRAAHSNAWINATKSGARSSSQTVTRWNTTKASFGMGRGASQTRQGLCHHRQQTKKFHISDW